jgi:hypothetical protein
MYQYHSHYHILRHPQVPISFPLPHSQTPSGIIILPSTIFSDTLRYQYPSHYHILRHPMYQYASHYHILRHHHVPISFSLPHSQTPSGTNILTTTTFSDTLRYHHPSHYHILRQFNLYPSLNETIRFTLIQNYNNFILIFFQSWDIYKGVRNSPL